jgi:hypothetical protein
MKLGKGIPTDKQIEQFTVETTETLFSTKYDAFSSIHAKC